MNSLFSILALWGTVIRIGRPVLEWKSWKSSGTKWAQGAANGPVWMPQAPKPHVSIFFWVGWTKLRLSKRFCDKNFFCKSRCTGGDAPKRDGMNAKPWMTNCETDGTWQDGGTVYGLSVVGGKNFGIRHEWSVHRRYIDYLRLFLTVMEIEKKSIFLSFCVR